MKCPNCGVSYSRRVQEYWLPWNGISSDWKCRTDKCPECSKTNIEISYEDTDIWRMVQPIAASRGPASHSIPTGIAADYMESCNVLPISSKASAALSRRCLQNILNSHGYKGRDLSKQIDAMLTETDASKAVGTALRDTVDAVRNFGNFSAHPVDDQTTLQVIDVEPEEAEWCLQIIEEMFDHFYVRPAQVAARKAALNAKLSAAGKPLAK